MDRETKIIRLSVLVLALALVFVYVLWFYIKGDSLNILKTGDVQQSSGLLIEEVKSEEGIPMKTGQVVNSEEGGEADISEIEVASLEGNAEDVMEDEDPDTIPYGGATGGLEQVQDDLDDGVQLIRLEEIDSEKGKVKSEEGIIEEQESFVPVVVKEKNILSGTKLYYGQLDFVNKLGISYDYALKDNKGIYYLYLSKEYDFADIARSLGGNIYTLVTEQDIIKNSLFGDKITFINVPEYKNKYVLMLVSVDDENWLIKLDYATYYQSKTYLRDLFTD